MTTLYRWFRDLDALASSGRFAALVRNNALVNVGITEGQTMTRIVMDVMHWHNPLATTPSTGPSIMDIPNQWIIVWDDGSDPNMDTANIDYVLANHAHDILHQGSWHWTSVWGFGTFDSIGSKAAFWDGVRDHTVEIRTSRKWREGGSAIQYPRYMSRALQTPQDSNPLPYHAKMSIALLAATPDALP